jgi:hypothetical protein
LAAGFAVGPAVGLAGFRSIMLIVYKILFLHTIDFMAAP